MLVSDGALWCFRRKYNEQITIDRHNLQTRETFDCSTICEYYSGSIVGVCTWGNLIAVLFEHCVVKAINQFGIQMTIITKEVHRQSVTPTALGSWGNSLCVGFRDGTTIVYTEEGKQKLKIPAAKAYDRVIAIASLGPNLYTQNETGIIKYNLFGQSTSIYQGSYAYPHLDKIISRGRVFTTYRNSAIQFNMAKEPRIDEMIFGNRVVSWMKRLWTISRDKNHIITWDLCEKWNPKQHASYPRDVKDSIKAIVCMARWGKFPVVHIPKELVHIIIGFAAYQWVPKFATKYTEPKRNAAKRRILD